MWLRVREWVVQSETMICDCQEAHDRTHLLMSAIFWAIVTNSRMVIVEKD
jgi:hypothetical protein